MSNYDMDFHDGPSHDADGVLEGSPLDMLRDELKKEVDAPDAVMNIPGRENIRCVYSTVIDGDLFQRWMKSSRRMKNSEDVDALKFSAIVLGAQLKTLEVRQKGEWVTATANGQNMNFQNDELRKLLVGDAPSNGSAYLVRKLYGNDGSVMNSAQSLLMLAGYGDQTDDLFGDEGPTQG